MKETLDDFVGVLPASMTDPRTKHSGSRLGSNLSPRILIADDDPISTSLASAAIQHLDGETIQVHDGATALLCLEQSNFDLAIVDLSMPKIDGLRLIAHIRATPATRRLPIIVITTWDDQRIIENAYGMGVESYLVKPINWKLLPYHVRFVLKAATAIAATRETNSTSN